CIDAAKITIYQNGGKHLDVGSFDGSGHRDVGALYTLRTEQPANIAALATPADQLARVREHFAGQLEKDLAKPGVARARAAYVAICLGRVDEIKRGSPQD